MSNIIFIDFILIIYIFEFINNCTTAKIISLFMGSFVFYLLLYNVTYNSDWDNYETMYYFFERPNDFLFNYIAGIFSSKGLEYSFVYKFHILLMGTSFVYFASRFSYLNVFAVISIYLLYQIIPLSNQIRYYVAFSFFLIAVYNLIVSKKMGLFYIFAILSILSHLAILLMYPFIYFYYKYKGKQYYKCLVSYSIVLAIFLYALSSVIFTNLFHFGEYFDERLLSSLRGGIFSFLIWLLWLLLILKTNERLVVSTSNSIEIDIKYQFLYKLSIYPIIFIPTSLVIQIIGHRTILASIIVWVTYVLYSLTYESSLNNRLRSMTIFLCLVWLTFYYQYILPTYLFGVSGTDLVEELIKYNESLNFLFL